MAHITSFRIHGLLGRKKLIEISLKRDVNIIFGENGCGKTTLLKILDAAMSVDAAAMHRLPVQKAEVNIYSERDQKTTTHVWERKAQPLRQQTLKYLANTEISDISEMRYELLRNHEISEWTIISGKKHKLTDGIRWSHTFLPTTRLYSSDFLRRPPGKQISEEQLDEAFADSVNKIWLLHYTKTLSAVRQIQNDGLRRVLYNGLSSDDVSPMGPPLDPETAYLQVQNFLSRQEPSSDFPAILGDLPQFASRYRKEPNLMRLVDNINTVEGQIAEAMKPIEKFIGAIDSLFSRGKRLQAQEKGLAVVLPSGQAITPANLSSGEKHLLKILLAAMTSGSHTVIVDEPELSMHIDWQRDLAATAHALNPNCQLIFASHSPEIMATIPDDRIFQI